MIKYASLVLFFSILVGCNSQEFPEFFGVKMENVKLTEEQVKNIQGIGVGGNEYINPLCTPYTDHTSTKDRARSWLFTKNTHQLVSFRVSLNANDQEIDRELQRIRDIYGKETYQDDVSNEWYAHANEKIKDSGILAIVLRVFRSYGEVSYSLVFLDEEDVCKP